MSELTRQAIDKVYPDGEEKQGKEGEMKKLFRHGKRFGMVAMAILLSGALLLGSVMPAKAAEERVVKIGLLSVFSGPGADTGVPCFTGIIDYTRFLNEHGGIGGVKVEALWQETRAVVPPAITGHKRLKVAGVVVEGAILGTQMETLAPMCQRDEIPLVGWTGFTPPNGNHTSLLGIRSCPSRMFHMCYWELDEAHLD